MSRYSSVLKWCKHTNRHGNKFKMTNLCNFDHYLILDFESTCEENKKLTKTEIIEFPCIWVDSNLNTLSTFHRYVKPTHNPVLSSFCTELTGIMQSMVEEEDGFDKVLAEFLIWMEDVENRLNKKNITKTFVTCGDWDLDVMLKDQCKLSGLSVPPSMSQWINLKKLFMEKTKYYPKSLNDMCNHLGLSFIGRAHSGIDDCWNILRIMKTLKSRYSLAQLTQT